MSRLGGAERSGGDESEREQLKDCSWPAYHVLVSFAEISSVVLIYLPQIQSLPLRQNIFRILVSN